MSCCRPRCPASGSTPARATTWSGPRCNCNAGTARAGIRSATVLTRGRSESQDMIARREATQGFRNVGWAKALLRRAHHWSASGKTVSTTSQALVGTLRFAPPTSLSRANRLLRLRAVLRFNVGRYLPRAGTRVHVDRFRDHRFAALRAHHHRIEHLSAILVLMQHRAPAGVDHVDIAQLQNGMIDGLKSGPFWGRYDSL